MMGMAFWCLEVAVYCCGAGMMVLRCREVTSCETGDVMRDEGFDDVMRDDGFGDVMRDGGSRLKKRRRNAIGREKKTASATVNKKCNAKQKGRSVKSRHKNDQEM